MRAMPELRDVTSDLQINNPQVNVDDRSRQGAALGSQRQADRGRALQRLRHAPDLDHLRAQQRVPGDPGTRAAVPGRPGDALAALRPRARADSWCRSTPSRTSQRTLGPLSVNHSGQLPAVTISFNLAPGVALGEALDDGRNSSPTTPCRPASPPASRAPPQAFQSSLRKPRVAAGHGDPRHLHRAGHPLRKLHPPADDPLRPAVGRLRRADHADDLSHGLDLLRLRRHHHAGRHRQEERHHDDRLRARGAAHRGQERRPRPSSRAACSASGRS